MDINGLTSAIIGAAIEVHKEVGPGLLESAYQRCMETELAARGLKFDAERPVALYYRGVLVDECAYKLDLLIEDLVVVELKSVEEIKPVYPKQLRTYLRLSQKSLGLLINFNEVLLKDGLVRVVNGLAEEVFPDPLLSSGSGVSH